MMEKTHLNRHPKFHANEASDHNGNSHSDDDYDFSDMSVPCSFSFDSNKNCILEDAYNEIIGGASLFQEGTNNYHLDDKHNIGSNADSPTADGIPLQPPPMVSTCSLRLTHSIAHDDLVQDKVIFFSANVNHGGNNSGIYQLSVVACDKSGNVIGEFNKHVKPLKNTCITEESTRVHGLSLPHPKIRNADHILHVGHDLWPLSKAVLMKVKRVVYLLLGVVNHVIVRLIHCD